ncbi:hypothetical protein D3C74_260090 [compost metagenome]
MQPCIAADSRSVFQKALAYLPFRFVSSEFSQSVSYAAVPYRQAASYQENSELHASESQCQTPDMHTIPLHFYLVYLVCGR